MNTWIKLLKGFGYVWLIFVGLLTLAGIIFVWSREGLPVILEIFNPFNTLNWFITFLTLSPGIGALIWAKKIKEKQLKNGE